MTAVFLCGMALGIAIGSLLTHLATAAYRRKHR